MLTFNIGPLAVAVHHALLLGSLLLATLVGWRVGRRAHLNPEKQLFGLLLVALLAARLAFVVAYFQDYREQPWRMLDIRDGGFIAWAGVLAALLAGGRVLYTHPRLRKPLGIAMSVGLLCWSLGSLALHGLQREARLPDLALLDLDGRPVNLHDLLGQPLVINLWATWCPPCRREMPVLIDAGARHPHIRFVLVNQAESAAEVQRYLQTQGLAPDNVLLDAHNELGRLAGSTALPTTLFYDAEGRQVGNHLGELSQASLTRALQVLQPLQLPAASATR